MSELNLYRGKREDNKTWVSGNHLYDEISGKHFIVPFGNVEESQKTGEDGCCYCVGFEVISETVGQYTGLDACNDNSPAYTPMFKGDIAQYDDGKTKFIGVVTQDGGAWGICTRDVIPLELEWACCCDNFISFWELMWNCDNPDCVMEDFVLNLTVIGNVYDNPELLEVQR